MHLNGKYQEQKTCCEILLFVSKEGLFLLSSLLHWNGIMLRYLMNLQTF